MVKTLSSWFKEPDKSLVTTNISWREYATRHGISVHKLIAFLEGTNVLFHYKLSGVSKTQYRVLPHKHFKNIGGCDIFICSGKSKQRYSQAKLTPAGVRILDTLYAKVFKKISNGLEVSKALKLSGLTKFKK